MVNKDNATPAELQEKITAMREGGKILGNLLRDLKNYVKPGMTGKEVDAWVRKEIVARGAKVAYDMLDEDFPGAICISVNDELVHGAPKDEPSGLVTRSPLTSTSITRVISPILLLRCSSVAKVLRPSKR